MSESIKTSLLDSPRKLYRAGINPAYTLFGIAQGVVGVGFIPTRTISWSCPVNYFPQKSTG